MLRNRRKGDGSGIVNLLHQRANGDGIVVGDFRNAAGVNVPSVEVLASGCPATATSLGGGCGSTLVAEGLPWTGGSVTTNASGLPVNSLALVVRGLAVTSLPLHAVLPQDQTGCYLLALTDLVELVVPSGASHSASLSLPNNPALAGIVILEQWLSLQFGFTQQIVAPSASNALALTVGAY